MQRSLRETSVSETDVDLDQACRALVNRESAVPAVARKQLLPVEGLLVPPKLVRQAKNPVAAVSDANDDVAARRQRLQLHECRVTVKQC